jgi:hypothetical protein
MFCTPHLIKNERTPWFVISPPRVSLIIGHSRSDGIASITSDHEVCVALRWATGETDKIVAGDLIGCKGSIFISGEEIELIRTDMHCT